MKCETCGRLPLHESPEARKALADEIRLNNRERLHRTESVLYGEGEEARLQMAAFLGGMLNRPPLTSRGSAYRPIRDLIGALFADISDATPDALDPNMPHPSLAEMASAGDER